MNVLEIGIRKKLHVGVRCVGRVFLARIALCPHDHVRKVFPCLVGIRTCPGQHQTGITELNQWNFDDALYGKNAPAVRNGDAQPGLDPLETGMVGGSFLELGQHLAVLEPLDISSSVSVTMLRVSYCKSLAVRRFLLLRG